MPWLTLKWKRKETRLAVTQKEREPEFSPFHNYFFSRNSIRGKICLTMEAELIKTWESFSQHWLLSENPPPPKNYLQFGSFFFRRFSTYSDIDCADNKSCVPSTLRQIVLQLEEICAWVLVCVVIHAKVLVLSIWRLNHKLAGQCPVKNLF